MYSAPDPDGKSRRGYSVPKHPHPNRDFVIPEKERK
jgi:hypothetical protein